MIPRTSLLLFVLALVAAPTAQERPLPELQAFLAQARTRLQTDNERQRSYIYVETQRERKLDGAGRVRSEKVKIVESYPPLPGEGERWERVLEENGRRKTEAELARQDAERQKTAEAVAKRLSSATDRAKATRDYQQDRKEALDRINDIFVVYDIKMAGRERLDGHDTIALTLEPKTNARPATREGKWMQYFRCRAWISEADHELVKLNVEAIRTASVGFGMLARINPGTEMTFSRRFINNEVWLPARADYNIKARVLMLKRYLQGGTIEFSNYRKFTVDTATTIAPPAQ
jgi:hypothetical protein